MPAASKAIKYTWIPKGAGRGGMFSNSTSHDSDTDTLVRVYDFLIDGGKWCPRPADTVFSNLLPGHAQAMFIYNFYNETSTVGTSKLLADLDSDGSPQANHAVYQVDDLSGGTFLKWGPLGQLPNGTKPRVNFASVKNRCFMTSGRGLAYGDVVTAGGGGATLRVSGAPFTASMIGMMVLTDDGIPYHRISAVADANNLTVVPNWNAAGNKTFYIGWDIPHIHDGLANPPLGATYVWGFAAQETNLTYHIAGPTAGMAGIQGTATATVGVAPFIVTWASGDTFDALNPGQNFYMNGYNWLILTVDSPTQITIDPATTPAPVAPAFGAAGPFAFQAGFGSLVGTTTLVNANTLAWVAGDNYAPLTGGLPFLIVGSKVYVGSFRATVTALPTPIAAAIVFDDPTTIPPFPANYDFQGNFGPMIWDVPGTTQRRSYSYGVAYYDPVTGHCSNASPILSVSDGRPNNDGVTITLSGIVTNNDGRFTQIIIARSALNGSTLYPLAIRPNTGGPLKYVDSQSDDTKLGSVGPGRLAIEKTANLPPPTTGSYIAYWDGRFWMADYASIGILFLSKSSQEMVGVVGVSEECWPQNILYQRTIPDSDGKITGLRTVGRNLFVTTDLAIYAVTGSGPGDYALERISAKGSGTANLATANLPAEDSQSGDVMVHFGNDQRLYFLYGQGGDLSYSYPIQDQFTASAFPAFWWKPETTSVGIVHDKRATYVLLSKTDAYEPPYSFLYDLDRKVWLETSLPPYSYVEGLYNGVLTRLVAASPNLGQPNVIYRAMSDTVNSVSAGTSIITQYVNVPETNRLDDKILQAIFLYCDDSNLIITVEAYVDENFTLNSMVRMPIVDAKYLAYLDAPNARIYQPQPSKIVRGRTFKIRIVMLSGITPAAKIPAFAALWSHAEADDNIGGNL